MSLYAVLSDIHGNYAALTAVEKDARMVAAHERHNAVEFICLGDVVDYGPQPNECVDWVRRHAAITIQGNHDHAAVEPLTKPPIEVDRAIWPILLWTRRELRERQKRVLRSWAHRQGRSALLSWFSAFHSDIDESGVYIDNVRAASQALERMATPFGLFGHTHVQGYYLRDARKVSQYLASAECAVNPSIRATVQLVPVHQWMPLPADGQRALFNPGSVGQPRRHALLGTLQVPNDYRAAYLLLRQKSDQAWELRFQRVDYPVAETVRLLRERVRWEGQPTATVAIATGSSQEIAVDDHPFARQLAETLATMDTLLPSLVERMIHQLMPPDSEMY